jgi:5-methylcytosine-specific restriction protein B
MKNPFSLSDEKLAVLLNGLSDWSKENEEEKKYAEDQRKKAVDLKKTLVNGDYLSTISDVELAENILSYSRTLEGPAHIRLGKPRISEQLPNIKRNLLYLSESDDEPFIKAARILEGDYRIPIFAKAFWTPIFQARYPDRLPNWNNKTERCLKKVGINLSTSKLNIENKYGLLSEAFLYLRNLDPKQDFHSLNHLMHFGTEVQQGIKMIEKLLEDEPENGLSSKIGKWRKKHIAAKRISVRKEAETKARNLLNSKAGGFVENDLREFFKLINKDYWKDKVQNNRFQMAYVGKNVNELVKQLGIVNEWIVRLWEASESEIEKLFDRFYSQNPIKNAGTAFPSVILYLRDPSKYNLCFKKMEQGLSNLTGFSQYGYSGDYYLAYNNKLNEFKTKYGLQPQEIDIILCIDENGGAANQDCPFTARTFKCLRGLHKNPTRDFYNKHKDDFKAYLENPFQDIFRKVAEKFTFQMRDYLEVEKGLFSRILKNDWGKGGAWDFYWGAFYPKGGKRIEDAQLFVWINQNIFEFGFYIGEYGIEQRQRFLSNCENNQAALENILSPSLSDERFIFGQWQRQLEGGAVPEHLKDLTWKEWLADPGDKGIHVAVFLTENDVLALSRQELVEQIYDVFIRLFPLVILTISEDPLPIMADYLGVVEPSIIEPPYSLVQCAQDTNIELNLLESWVRAIERKGQAVIYGPPGTGKTYVAEHLARHLIGGGNGFKEVVQFHPAYAYEDFIQGIRPKAKSDGQLDYPIVHGRFLKFCKNAKKCKDPCVLIIDEINRANLARVFGELMYLLEYRDQEVPLASGGLLRIPKNVRIIGTMNTADRSIALVDHALRRRFAFLALYPNFNILRLFHKDADFNVKPLINVLNRLNNQIGDRHYDVGITFFLRKDLSEQIEDIWRMEIEPYLEEYFFDQPDKTDTFRWDKVGKEIIL